MGTDGAEVGFPVPDGRRVSELRKLFFDIAGPESKVDVFRAKGECMQLTKRDELFDSAQTVQTRFVGHGLDSWRYRPCRVRGGFGDGQGMDRRG